jgi:hypothetical protein
MVITHTCRVHVSIEFVCIRTAVCLPAMHSEFQMQRPAGRPWPAVALRGPAGGHMAASTGTLACSAHE